MFETKLIGDRIRSRRLELGLTLDDVASAISVNKSTIQRYEMGTISRIKLPVISAIAGVLRISPDWILGLPPESISIGVSSLPSVHIDGALKRGKAAGISIPVLGNVAAGVPIEAIQDIVDYEEIDASLAATGDFFGLRIKGNSMEPRIREGDVVIVRRQADAETGDTVVALVNGDSATVKRIKKEADGGIWLIPNNPAYDSRHFSPTEISDLPVTIIGKVVELRGKF